MLLLINNATSHIYINFAVYYALTGHKTKVFQISLSYLAKDKTIIHALLITLIALCKVTKHM